MFTPFTAQRLKFELQREIYVILRLHKYDLWVFHWALHVLPQLHTKRKTCQTKLFFDQSSSGFVCKYVPKCSVSCHNQLWSSWYDPKWICFVHCLDWSVVVLVSLSLPWSVIVVACSKFIISLDLYIVIFWTHFLFQTHPPYLLNLQFFWTYVSPLSNPLSMWFKSQSQSSSEAMKWDSNLSV